jgi:hypothetical protein
MPTTIMVNMASDTSLVERDRQALTACGAKAAVVNTAAAMPIHVGENDIVVIGLLGAAAICNAGGSDFRFVSEMHLVDPRQFFHSLIKFAQRPI